MVRLTRPSADVVRISVEDSGGGITEGLDVFRLFEITKPGGSGIGLAVAREIVSAHGGRISHRAAAPAGTVFEVDLPRGDPSPGEIR